MNRKQNYTTPPHWQKAQTVLKRIVIRLHNNGVIPADQVEQLFRKFPGLRDA